MGLAADGETNKEGEEDADGTRGHVHESGSLRVVDNVLDQRGGVGSDDAARDGELG